jgi:rhodopsin domain-containing protein
MLMGLGLLCACAVIPKIFSLRKLNKSPDNTWVEIDLVLWSLLETYIGIITACLPTLKSLFETMLRKMGMDFTETNTRQLNTYDDSLESQEMDDIDRSQKLSD